MSLQVPAAAILAVSSFHGFHIHANDDPANGDGCQADPAAEPSEWFVSADGHLKQEGQLHGDHDGDMAPLFLDSNGSAEATFTIEGSVDELDSRVVIVHAGPQQLERPGRQRAQPVQPQQSRRSGPHPGHRKCWRPGRLRRDHRWSDTRSEGQRLPSSDDRQRHWTHTQRVPERGCLGSRRDVARSAPPITSPGAAALFAALARRRARDMSHRDPCPGCLDRNSRRRLHQYIRRLRQAESHRAGLPNVPRRRWGLHPYHRYRPATGTRPNTSTEPLAQARRRRTH